MLEVGNFASVKIRGWNKPYTVFVRSYDNHRKTAVILIVDRLCPAWRFEMELGKKDILSVEDMHPAPIDLRDWEPVKLCALLTRECEILEYHHQKLREMFPREKNSHLTVFGKEHEEWLKYWKGIEGLRISPLNAGKACDALMCRQVFALARRLPNNTKLNRNIKKRLLKKQKMRHEDKHRWKINYIIPDSTVGRQKPPKKKKKLMGRTVNRSRPVKPKLWVVPNNDYPHPPPGWPEEGPMWGTPEECFAFSGAMSPTGRTYICWLAGLTWPPPMLLECEHGKKSGCKCSTARQHRYEMWLGVEPGVVQWKMEKQFFITAGSKILFKPPDWPEIYQGRLWAVSEEQQALEGAENKDGLTYRVWFNENFYRDFCHKGGCRCTQCVIARYKAWNNAE